MLALIWSADFLLHIPCCFHFNGGSFSDTSRAGFTFIWVVSLTHPMLALLFCGEFLLHIPCLLFFLIWGVSLTHPILAKKKKKSGEILLHIPCWFPFFSFFFFLFQGSSGCVSRAGFILCGRFSDTSRAGFIFIWVVSSYTSHAGYFF